MGDVMYRRCSTHCMLASSAGSILDAEKPIPKTSGSQLLHPLIIQDPLPFYFLRSLYFFTTCTSVLLPRCSFIKRLYLLPKNRVIIYVHKTMLYVI